MATPADVAFVAPLDNSFVNAMHCLGSLLQYKTTADADTKSLVSVLRSLLRSLAPTSSGLDHTLIVAAVIGALLHDGHSTGNYPSSRRPSSPFQHGDGPARALTMAMPSGPRTGVPASSFPGPTPGGTTPVRSTVGTIAARGSSWPHATETSPRTFVQFMGPAEKALPVGQATGWLTSTHMASTREDLVMAVQPAWLIETNLRPEEVTLGNFENALAGTSPNLRRAVARPTGISNVELLDLSFFGGCCYVTLHDAAVKRFVWAVRWEVLDVASSATEADKVVEPADFD